MSKAQARSFADGSPGFSEVCAVCDITLGNGDDLGPPYSLILAALGGSVKIPQADCLFSIDSKIGR